MKKNQYIKHLAIAACIVMGGVAFTACDDEPDKYETAGGVPTVSYVRLPNLAAADSLVSEASLQTTVCLVGDNLRSITEIYFNDQKAILNTSYITDHTLIVDIPKGIPDVTTNKIYMVTANKDTVTYDFGVVVPAPVISSMSCEYAEPGSKASLSGQYFVDDASAPLKITFTGGATVTDYEAATDASRSSVSFTIPEGAEPGPITVTSIYGTSKSAFYYKDTRGMLFDFDGATGLGNHGWHAATITSDETSITGNFVQLGNGTATMDASTWDDSHFSFEYWAGSWNTPTDYPEGEGIRLYDLVDFSNFSNMALKFELFVPSSSAWSMGDLHAIFAGTDLVSMGNAGTDIYGLPVAGCNNTYFQTDDLPQGVYRPWASSGSYDTGDQWVTVTMPLSGFTYGWTGTATRSLMQSDFASLVLFLVANDGTPAGTACTPILKIDNVRVVPNK